MVPFGHFINITSFDISLPYIIISFMIIEFSNFKKFDDFSYINDKDTSPGFTVYFFSKFFDIPVNISVFEFIFILNISDSSKFKSNFIFIYPDVLKRIDF